MDSNVIRETRIFVPNAGLFARPVPWPNVFGHVARPIAEMPCLCWFWLSRYVDHPDSDDHKDCDPHNFPSQFYWVVQEQPALVSFRLRYALACDRCDAFEKAAKDIAVRPGCIPRYFRDYSLIGDLGGDRFTAIDDRRKKRSDINLTLVQAASHLVFDALVQPPSGGDYTLEPIAFDIPHHLVSNILGKPG